jgi:predicted DNA-binding protein
MVRAILFLGLSRRGQAMREKNDKIVAKISPAMKRQVFAIAEQRGETAATILREMIRASLENLEKTA